MLKDVGMVVLKIRETRQTNYAYATMADYNNITLYSSEFRVHATTKMDYNSRMQTRACNNNNMGNPSLFTLVSLVFHLTVATRILFYKSYSDLRTKFDHKEILAIGRSNPL